MSLKTPEELGTTLPSSSSIVVRPTKWLKAEDREKVQKATEYNVFAFPASMLVCDYLSDSGTSAMTDVQWAALFRGDEAYGRNHGYFAMLQAVRNTFERGDDPDDLASRILADLPNDTFAPSEEWLNNPSQGGFVNGGIHQLTRPNFFLVPQGRCAEHLLFSVTRELMLAEQYETDPTSPPMSPKMHTILSLPETVVREQIREKRKGLKTGRIVVPCNGFFDTTEAHAHVNKIIPKNLLTPHFDDPFDISCLYKSNPFKGNIDLQRLEEVVQTEGKRNIPFILLTITNNTAAGQPVSMENIKETYKIAEKYGLPLFYDAARFAENAFFIREFEKGYHELSIPEIVKEMFSYCDGIMMSMKKDALCNIGGFLCFKDKGKFHSRFSRDVDVGIRLKEKQILEYGNDSYGALSGRDIMAAAIGLREVLKLPYLQRRVLQTRELAQGLAEKGVPVILPPGGHAVYLDMDKFFEGMETKVEDFRGVGLTIELIRQYGIRACELGPFAFEWDQKSETEREGIHNLVRFAIPRNAYNDEHINYTIAAVVELHKKRHLVPKVKIQRGATLHLRHFQSGLAPVYD